MKLGTVVDPEYRAALQRFAEVRRLIDSYFKTKPEPRPREEHKERKHAQVQQPEKR